MAHAPQSPLASLLAASAGFGTYAAVFMLTSMGVTFVTAEPAGRRTGIEHAPDDLLVETGPAARHSPRHCTQVSTVEVKPNALGQILNHTLSKAGIGTAPAVGAILMSASTVIVAINAQSLRWVKL